MFLDSDRPNPVSRLLFYARTLAYFHLVLKKKFARLDGMPQALGLWNVFVYGPNITMGKNCLIIAGDGNKVNLTTCRFGKKEGKITIADNVTIMNGVRVQSADEIIIGEGTMLANFCYIMDADWHDIHKRIVAPGRTAPVILERGVWIGDSAIVCKGVRIGENSIVGAGSVVRRDVPPNSIVIGNPAEVVGKVDPGQVVLRGQEKEFYARLEALAGRGQR